MLHTHHFKLLHGVLAHVHAPGLLHLNQAQVLRDRGEGIKLGVPDVIVLERTQRERLGGWAPRSRPPGLDRGPPRPSPPFSCCEHVDTHPDGEVTFALAHGLLVSLPLVWSAGLGNIRGLLPPQALAKLIHLRGHVLPGPEDTERHIDLIPDHELKEHLRISHCGDVSHRILRQLGYI